MEPPREEREKDSLETPGGGILKLKGWVTPEMNSQRWHKPGWRWSSTRRTHLMCQWDTDTGIHRWGCYTFLHTGRDCWHTHSPQSHNICLCILRHSYRWSLQDHPDMCRGDSWHLHSRQCSQHSLALRNLHMVNQMLFLDIFQHQGLDCFGLRPVT